VSDKVKIETTTQHYGAMTVRGAGGIGGALVAWNKALPAVAPGFRRDRWSYKDNHPEDSVTFEWVDVPIVAAPEPAELPADPIIATLAAA
jgi:hypothetical protein